MMISAACATAAQFELEQLHLMRRPNHVAP